MSWFVLVSLFLSSLWSLCLCGETPNPHRSPIDITVLPGGTRALTANHTSDTASLIDLKAGKVLAEVRCGRKPAAIACSSDGKRAAVSNLWSASVTLLEIDGDALKVVGPVDVGPLPRALTFAPDNDAIYVAVAGADEIAKLDWRTRTVKRHWPAPREPRELALSKDGRWLVAASTRSGQVRCWDTEKGNQV